MREPDEVPRGLEEEPMHPEILRELTSQRGREMRDQAHRAGLVRMASRARRARRHGLSGPGETDEFVVPAVPDYVDGSFRVQPAEGEAARVPTTGRAA
jgi:hypothetical protein